MNGEKNNPELKRGLFGVRTGRFSQNGSKKKNHPDTERPFKEKGIRSVGKVFMGRKGKTKLWTDGRSSKPLS